MPPSPTCRTTSSGIAPLALAAATVCESRSNCKVAPTVANISGCLGGTGPSIRSNGSKHSDPCHFSADAADCAMRTWASGPPMRANAEGASNLAKESMMITRAPRSRAHSTVKKHDPAPVVRTMSGRSRRMMRKDWNRLRIAAITIRTGAPSLAWPSATCATKWTGWRPASVRPSAVSSVTKK